MPSLVTAQEFSDSAYGSLEDQVDTPIPQLLDAAEAHIQGRLRRKILIDTYTESMYATSNTIFVTNRPLIAVTSLTRSIYPMGGSPTTVPLDRLYLRSEAGYFDPSYPVSGYFVTVTYTAGYATAPADIKQAIIIQAAIIASPDYELLGVGDGKEPGIGHLQKLVDRLIEPYQLRGIA